MKKKIIMFLIVVVGASLGVAFLPGAWDFLNIQNKWLETAFINGLIGAIIFFIISLFLTGTIVNLVNRIDREISKMSLQKIIFTTLGLAAGLIISGLIAIPFFLLKVPVLNSAVPVIIMASGAYLGFRIGTGRMDEMVNVIGRNSKKPKTEVQEPGTKRAGSAEEVLDRRAGNTTRKYKILDTSVIIDGRIYDIAKTGFIEGTILIPKFVLFELQYIADSADSLKRVRGRRGLDILNALQKEEDICVEMYDGDWEDIPEVDTKLLKLAKQVDGVVVTNDFNLNKVAEFQNVPVLNINALANAVKPVVIPGEKMDVMVVKNGSERQQGVAYLDDGTMVVVEDGQHYMNERITVVVTSALQTAAGRMIFAKPDHAGRGIGHNA
jgi:uncharacterized protein YacL